MCDQNHATMEEAGNCPDHAARYREVVEGIARRSEAPYWWLSFVERIDDETGSVAMRQGIAILPAPDFSTAVDTAWLTGCNPGGEVVGYELDRGDVERAQVPTFTLLDGVDLAAAQEALRVAHEGTGR
jgi:hypothetical protein